MRTFAVSTSEGDWENLVTSVFVTANTVEAVKNQQEKMPLLRNNEIALFFKVMPFDYTLFGDIDGGVVKFPTPFGFNKVRFRKFDATKLSVGSTQERISGSYRWVFNAVGIGNKIERVGLWDIVKNNENAVKTAGFPDLSTLWNRLRIEYGTGAQKDFELVIPSLASIENAHFVNSRFEVEVKKAIGLKDLQLNLTLARDNIPIWISEPRKVKDEKSVTFEAATLVTETIDLRDVLPYDSMNVELILRESALTFDKKTVFAPLENTVEPFLKTLDAFCTLKELESMLVEPHRYPKADEIFENSVTWLLSLVGYNPIHLGRKFEKCKTATLFQLGTADIIAYEENKRILLIDCDSGPIDPKKIQQLIELGKYLSESLPVYRGLEIIPILVTPRDYDGQPKKGVRIVDRKSIERIFDELSKGKRKSAMDIFCEFGY